MRILHLGIKFPLLRSQFVDELLYPLNISYNQTGVDLMLYLRVKNYFLEGFYH